MTGIDFERDSKQAWSMTDTERNVGEEEGDTMDAVLGIGFTFVVACGLIALVILLNNWI